MQEVIKGNYDDKTVGKKGVSFNNLIDGEVDSVVVCAGNPMEIDAANDLIQHLSGLNRIEKVVLVNILEIDICRLRVNQLAQ